MTFLPYPASELALAVLLLATSGASVLWLRREAAAVDAVTEVRRTQLQCLFAVERSAGALVQPRPRDLQGLAGLFEGQDLVWKMAPMGSYLAFRPVALPAENQ